MFKKELEPFIKGKGTIQFPLDNHLPLKLIKKITEYRVKETSKKIKSSKKNVE